MAMSVRELEGSAVRVIIGILALLLGILALFAFDAFGLTTTCRRGLPTC